MVEEQEPKKRRNYIFYSILLAAALITAASTITQAANFINTDGYINLSSSCTNLTNGTCTINYNTTRYAGPTRDGILSAADWIRFNSTANSTSNSSGGGNISGASNSSGSLAVWTGTGTIANSSVLVDTPGNIYIKRNLLLANYGSDSSILFNNGLAGGIYWVQSSDRVGMKCNGAGNGLCEVYGSGIYFFGTDDATIDLYSDSIDRNVLISNGGSKGANLVVDNNITAGETISAPQICLDGDCRTTWPTSSGGSSFRPEQTNYYYKSYDFESVTAAYGTPWAPAAIGSGTTALIESNYANPGLATVSSSTTASSGYSYQITGANTYLLGNGSGSIAILAPVPKTGNTTTCKLGFQDVFTATSAVDGAYWNATQNSSTTFNWTPVMRTNNVEVRGSIVTYPANTSNFYKAQVYVVNRTQVQYTLYNSSNGVLLNSQLLNGTVPSVPGRATSHAAVCFVNGVTTAQVLARLDYISVYNNASVFTR